jgi:hypothetical protein
MRVEDGCENKDMDRGGYGLFQLPEKNEENNKKIGQDKQ